MPRKERRTPITVAEIRDLHTALLEIVSAINEPQRDDALIRGAGISLDRALLPLLVVIDRFGPISVGELAGRAGRDYTTVSRQVAKLESRGLAHRVPGSGDRRVHRVSLTGAGRAMTRRVDRAREGLARGLFRHWTRHDSTEFVRLLRKFAQQTRLGRPMRS